MFLRYFNHSGIVLGGVIRLAPFCFKRESWSSVLRPFVISVFNLSPTNIARSTLWSSLTSFNLALSLLGAYVHTCRLQYVEYFGKFYEGGVRAFTPVKAEEKYINLKK